MDKMIRIGSQPRLIPDVSGASNDMQLIALWLDSFRSSHTRRGYKREVALFVDAMQKPLHQVSLMDMQAFVKVIEHHASATQARILSTVKSLFSYAQRVGYLTYNVAAPIRLPAKKNTLAERILSEEEVHRMLLSESSVRNQLMVRLFYSAGLRVSELCALKWRDLRERGDTGQITVYGKGGKTRAVLLSPPTWKSIVGQPRAFERPSDPIFVSRKKKGHLNVSMAYRVVRAAAQGAGIVASVSPHWLRHAHASHALERGAPIHLVQATLGHASVATTGAYLHARPNESSSRYLAV